MASQPDQPDPEAELLAAYADGVGELSPAERRAIEARLPALAEDVRATRDVLAALRALPGEGNEPVWPDLAKAISAEVGDRVPRAWWRRWLVPATTASALAACAAIALYASAGSRAPAPSAPVAVTAPAAHADAPRAEPTAAVYLDGEAVELGDLDSAALDDPDERDDADVVGGALLPTPDLAWIDDLDSDSLAIAERWLADRKGS